VTLEDLMVVGNVTGEMLGDEARYGELWEKARAMEGGLAAVEKEWESPEDEDQSAGCGPAPKSVLLAIARRLRQPA